MKAIGVVLTLLAALIGGHAAQWYALGISVGADASGPLRQEERTPYGRALVLREPEPKGGNHA